MRLGGHHHRAALSLINLMNLFADETLIWQRFVLPRSLFGAVTLRSLVAKRRYWGGRPCRRTGRTPTCLPAPRRVATGSFMNLLNVPAYDLTNESDVEQKFL